MHYGVFKVKFLADLANLSLYFMILRIKSLLSSTLVTDPPATESTQSLARPPRQMVATFPTLTITFLLFTQLVKNRVLIVRTSLHRR